MMVTSKGAGGTNVEGDTRGIHGGLNHMLSSSQCSRHEWDDGILWLSPSAFARRKVGQHSLGHDGNRTGLSQRCCSALGLRQSQAQTHTHTSSSVPLSMVGCWARSRHQHQAGADELAGRHSWWTIDRHWFLSFTSSSQLSILDRSLWMISIQRSGVPLGFLFLPWAGISTPIVVSNGLASFVGDQTTGIVSVSLGLPLVLLLFPQGCPHFFSCSTR